MSFSFFIPQRGRDKTLWPEEYAAIFEDIQANGVTATDLADHLAKRPGIWIGEGLPPNTVDYPIRLYPWSSNPDTTAPTAPVLAVPTVSSDNDVTLDWSASPGTDVSGIWYYQIWRSTGAGTTPVLYVARADGTTYIDENTVAGTTYVYGIKAVDPFYPNSPASALSNTREVTTGSALLQNHPDLLAMFVTNTALTGQADGTAIATFNPSYGSLVGSLSLTQATEANKPLVASATLNGTKKVLKCTAASLHFIQGTITPAITGSCTQFFVVKINPVAGTTLRPVTGINTTPYRGIGASSVNPSKVTSISGNTGNTHSALVGTVTLTNVWRVIAVTHQDPTLGAATSLFDTSKTPVTGTLSIDSATNQISSLRYGRNSGGSSTYVDFEVAEHAIVNGILSDSDIGGFMDEMAARNGLTVSA